MRSFVRVLVLLLFALSGAGAKALPQTAGASADPFLWLEDKDGARAMAWVRKQNARTVAVFERDPHYARFYGDALSVLRDKRRIPFPSQRNGSIYNFWQDASHAQGIWRRTTVRSYASAAPHWTTVVDLDAISKREHVRWVWHDASCEPRREQRCLLYLSNGGEDAATVREFDLKSDRFVTDGFVLPRGKQRISWVDADTLLVAREWSPGAVTTSGYPYIVKRLRRGQRLEDAVEIFRGSRADVSVDPVRYIDSAGNSATIVDRNLTFFTSKHYLMTPRGLQLLNLPAKSDLQGLFDGKLLVILRQPWMAQSHRYPQGSLIAIGLREARNDPTHLRPQLVYAPGKRETLDDVVITKSAVVLLTYNNVRGRALRYTPRAGGWRRQILNLPDNSSIERASSTSKSDSFYLDVTTFLRPTQLYLGNAGTGSVAVIKASPSQFDAANDVVEQFWATSRDGTAIPYFVVHPAHMPLDGSNPTVINAYGGFDISMTPFYSGVIGKLWLAHGGVFVLANIRGGGEFGPAWHEAGLKTHRQRIYDDFYAVAKDLVSRKITSPQRLGIMGGSNGGLLVGVEFIQHPKMWTAVDIEVPLLDMLRYEKIEAGSLWVAEYGSVSVPAERAFLAKISPYQNLRADVNYPEPFVWTTTKDDRVGPQHARKFAAKLEAMHKPYLFYEVIEGGHGSGANPTERARTDAFEWTYFAMKLGLGSKT